MQGLFSCGGSNSRYRGFCNFVEDIASQMGIKLALITVDENTSIGGIEIYLMRLSAKGQTSHAIVYQSDIEDFQKGKECNRLELTIRSSLARLITKHFESDLTEG